ncbi:hypothetical protein QRD89_07555 [Halobacillus sp. ACCC02827]|uniref:hypothetical protein n=1 Tax=unclassified Halobacillus TaxID=2636472 RepID=UPI0002A509B8|nr:MULTISPECIES: hypothetical protein [unclassified Halobacillus]ELK44857.1 hypothetical protein D479_17429 [Halobacillus sp. BAB-2008]WJE17195.1 hypothetical protein QRD89_07555 [Halobacillus sp. ACCC02827]
MLMKLCFMLSALSIPLSMTVDQAGWGLIVSLFFLLSAAFFSKPRFADHPNV